jgi:GNAT superfamily N-acetyltransferase
MAMNIVTAETEAQIRACYPAFSELRPHLSEQAFVAQVQRQIRNHNYRLVCAIHDDRIVAAAGFRVAEFLAWGKTFYLDDLIVPASVRRQGYGGRMLDWLLQEAINLECAQFHLDSGTHRHDAHRLYLSRKLRISSFHLSCEPGHASTGN